VIDADASPSGYIAWYNHYSECSRVRAVRPVQKNERFGVQRMEMLAIYFALADNLRDIRRIHKTRKRRVVIAIRSDSKSTVEQLQGLSQIRDTLMRRIFFAIAKLLAKVRYIILFDHLNRSYNKAGHLLEQRRRKEVKEKISGDLTLFHQSSQQRSTSDKVYLLLFSSSDQGFRRDLSIEISSAQRKQNSV